MANTIDVVVVLDTEALNAAYPNGIAQHQKMDDLSKYFSVLTDHEHTSGSDGIKCNVNDTIYFRTVSKADNAHGAIILEFADKSQGLDPNNLTDYISIPSFRTSRWAGYSYDNSKLTRYYSTADGWKMWDAALKEGDEVLDPHMMLQALQSTSALPQGSISYTLGFRVTYPGFIRDYWFDPTITIS
ncbi:MAG: hypothetical protein JKX81_12355 [Arenicella sp.]|nr:hypothetical protein [Arenicella sp.]